MPDFANAVRGALGAPQEDQPTQPDPLAAAVQGALSDENSRRRSSVLEAGSASPDQAARAKVVAQRLGTPVDPVLRNLPEAERQVLVQDVEEQTRDTRVLRSAFDQPYFAKVAKDDLPALTQVERAVRRLFDPTADDRKRSREAAGAVGRFLADSAKQVAMGATVNLGAGIIDTAGMAADLVSGATGSVWAEELARTYSRMADRARESMNYFSDKPEGNSAAGWQSGLRSVGTNLTLLPAGIAGGVNAMLVPMATMVGAEAFNQARSKGQDRVDAAIYAAPHAVFEYAFGKVPASRLLADIAKNSSLMKMIGNQLLPEVIGEQATTLLQDFNEWVRLNPQKTAREFIEERPDAAVQTLVATLVGIGVQGGVIRGVQRVLDRASDTEEKAKDANVFANNMAELLNIAAGSNLRTRDADSFAEFARQVAGDTGSPTGAVFVDAAKLAEVLDKAGVDLATFSQMSPTAAQELPDAVQSGGSVSIPLADLVGRMGDSGIEQNLLPHLRASEDALSQEEADIEMAAAQDVLKQNAERFMQQAEDAAQVEASAETVRETLMGELQAAGRFSQDVNRAYATLVGSFYTVLGGQLGITPEQAYAAYPLQVRAVTPQGQVLNREDDIGAQLEARVAADYEGAVREYGALADAEGGRVLNTDLARELSPEYRADRTRSAEVHEAASAFVKRRYADLLSKPTPAGFKPFVLMTGGGTGAGKSTGLKAAGGEVAGAEIVFDTNMNSLGSAVTKIEQALAAGREVRIAYTFRDPVEALTRGALPRAMRMGRTVPLASHVETHVGARKVIEELIAKYQGDPRVQFTLIDNSRGKGKASVTTLDKLPQVNENGLGERLYEALQKELQEGRISEAVARGTAGRTAATAAGANAADRGAAGPRAGGQPEPAAARDDAVAQHALQQATDEAVTGLDLREPATLVDFTPEGLPDLLQKTDWAVLTAADPGATKQSDEANALANAALRQDLDELGVDYVEATGKYGDVQPSFIVTGIPEAQAQRLGNKYGQESILTRRGLVYADGSVTPATGMNVFDQAPEDYYTEVPSTNAFFSVELDFDTRIPAPAQVFNQSGRAEGDTKYQARARELLDGLRTPKRSAVSIFKGDVQLRLMPTNFDIARYFTRTNKLDDPTTPQATKAIVDALYADALHALSQAGSAVGWYDAKVKAALANVAVLHPELATDEQAKFGFVAMLAITSNSTDVNENFKKAEALYRRWRETGDFPTDVPDAKAANQMRDGLATVKRLVAEHGWQKVRDFMVADQSIADIQAFSGEEIAGELSTSKVYGAVFLGSKIGAFFNNLYGNFTPVTMDRWFMRSIGRVQGSMLQFPPSIGNRLAELREQIDSGTNLYGQTAAELHADIDAYEALPDRTNVEAVLKALPHVLAYSKARNAVYAKGTTDSNGVTRGFTPRTRENVLAKTLYEDLTLDVQAPAGGGERVRLRGIMSQVQQKLAAGGIPIDMADLQAALWYYEKDLFALLKGQTRQGSLFDGVTVEAEDYETASRRLLDGARPGDTGQGGPGQQPVAARARPAARREQRVDTTGELFQQPVAVTGTHFSRQPRERLSGAAYGTGLKGLEAERLRNATDPRLKQRVYFYVDEGTGVRPEAGVGGYAHSVPLQNLYDAKVDPDGLWRGDINDIESRILDAGYDGYYIRNAFNNQGAAVVIGPASQDIPATPLPSFERGAPVRAAEPQPYKRGLTSAELRALNIDAVAAKAPSAKVRAGTFTVDAAEFAAARDAMSEQGIALPEPVLAQNARGTYSPSQMTISMLETADLTTFLHETGHFMLDVMGRVASTADAPVQVREDMDKLLAWFGVKDLATWTSMPLEDQRPHHEKFAESFEQYLFEGKAPSRELTPLFQRFSAWMKSVYRSISDFLRGHNTQLSDEVRAVFDRMLATEEQIAQKEEDYAFSAMLSDRPPNMTDQEFADYLMANQMATGEAIDELQARSLRDLRWVLNARGRALTKLKQGVAEKRKAIEAEVRVEVQAMPVYAIQRWLKHGITPEGAKTEGAKLNTEDLRDIFGDGPAAPWRYLATNMVSNERALSLHPDEVAQMFPELGYTSGEQMVRDIIAAFPEDQTIQGLTDTRMLERHGDIASPQALDAAANEAVHNEYRARALATELKAMSQATQPVRVLQAAAKAFAEKLIGNRRLKDVRPKDFEAAERRAAKRASQLGATGGDLQGAVVAKRDQVLQFFAAKAAHQALDEARKARELFTRIVTRPDDTVGKSRDMDLVNVTRAILANYGFGAKAKTAHDYLNVLSTNDPVMYDTVKDRVIAAELNGKPFAELTVDEMRALVDEVQSLWLLAKRSKQIEVDGQLMSREQAQEELTRRLEEIGIPGRVPGEGRAVTPAEQRMNMFRAFVASLRRVEQWVGAKDGADTGPFRKYVFNAIKDAADNYRHDRGRYIKRYRQLLQEVAPDMKRGFIDAPELNYTFGYDSGGVGMNELLHALLHTGNESNKRKLLLGRKWATELPDGTLDTSRWDSFVQRMVDEGRLTKRHYDFAQGVWDMLEDTKGQAQKMHRDVFGRYFNEVTAEGFTTPFGSYRGGYVPAMTDSRVVADKKTRELAEEENQSMAFAFPATNKGFTKARVEYNRELLLDLRTLAGHIDKVLLFSHMEGPVRDVRRLLTGKNVAYALNRVDPTAFDSLLTPWLNRAARQTVETPVAGSAGLMRFFSGARANAGMAAMFANVSNTVQQITGLSTAAIRVPPRLLLAATGQYIAAPRQMADAVAEASKFMRSRMENEVAAMHDAIDDILLDPSLYQRSRAWARRHAYFMQAAFDNVIGPIVWTAAHNDAVARGMSDLDAQRHADGVVRTTQGSALPEDVSRIETGNAFVRLFTQFAGYFNMLANTTGTELIKVTDSIGLRRGAGKALYILLFGALTPAWIAESIALAFKGGPGDEDDDGWYIDDWLKAVFGYGTLRTATAMVPGVGPAINAGVNAWNNKPYDDRISTSPAVSMIESAVRAPVSVYNALADEGNRQKAVRDVATAVSMATGLPAAAVARPLGYAAGVAQGKIEPDGPVDLVRGMATGSVDPDTRQ